MLGLTTLEKIQLIGSFGLLQVHSAGSVASCQAEDCYDLNVAIGNALANTALAFVTRRFSSNV